MGRKSAPSSTQGFVGGSCEMVIVAGVGAEEKGMVVKSIMMSKCASAR